MKLSEAKHALTVIGLIFGSFTVGYGSLFAVFYFVWRYAHR